MELSTYIFFGLALVGLGWLWGNYVKEKERMVYTQFIIDLLVANRYIRTHRIEILPKVYMSNIIPWDTSDKDLKNVKVFDAFKVPKSFTGNNNDSII